MKPYENESIFLKIYIDIDTVSDEIYIAIFFLIFAISN
jgi:hypothetical protein